MSDKILMALEMARDFHQPDSKMYATIDEAIEEHRTAPNEYFEMLWKWFADASRHGAAEMRSNHEGLSAADFEEMLDEHEAALLGPQATVIRPAAFLAWAIDTFGSIAKLRSERLKRFTEEAIELAHADGMTRDEFDAIANRVFERPAGDLKKEIGQAQACLETYAENLGLSSTALAEIEWQRVRNIPREEWRRRHNEKAAIGIALPVTEDRA